MKNCKRKIICFVCGKRLCSRNQSLEEIKFNGPPICECKREGYYNTADGPLCMTCKEKIDKNR